MCTELLENLDGSPGRSSRLQQTVIRTGRFHDHAVRQRGAETLMVTLIVTSEVPNALSSKHGCDPGDEGFADPGSAHPQRALTAQTPAARQEQKQTHKLRWGAPLTRQRVPVTESAKRLMLLAFF